MRRTGVELGSGGERADFAEERVFSSGENWNLVRVTFLNRG